MDLTYHHSYDNITILKAIETYFQLLTISDGLRLLYSVLVWLVQSGWGSVGKRWRHAPSWTDKDLATFKSESDDKSDQATPTQSRWSRLTGFFSLKLLINKTWSWFVLTLLLLIYSVSYILLNFAINVCYASSWMGHIHAAYIFIITSSIYSCSPLLLLHWSSSRLSDLLKGSEQNSC